MSLSYPQHIYITPAWWHSLPILLVSIANLFDLWFAFRRPGGKNYLDEIFFPPLSLVLYLIAFFLHLPTNPFTVPGACKLVAPSRRSSPSSLTPSIPSSLRPSFPAAQDLLLISAMPQNETNKLACGGEVPALNKVFLQWEQGYKQVGDGVGYHMSSWCLFPSKGVSTRACCTDGIQCSETQHRKGDTDSIKNTFIERY